MSVVAGELGVVAGDEHAVGRADQVRLDEVRPHPDGQLVAGEGVLGPVPRRAPVPDDDRCPHGRTLPSGSGAGTTTRRLRCSVVRVLVIGSGAREHAIVLALAQDPGVTALACAPGNAGTAAVSEQHGVDVTDAGAVTALAQRWTADLVVIGPEVPLVAGIADAVRGAGIACFGPSAAAARIEGSKAFAKDVMAAAGVPHGERPRSSTTPRASTPRWPASRRPTSSRTTGSPRARASW